VAHQSLHQSLHLRSANPGNPPDPRTLETMSDVLFRVACTPDPAGFFRQAMRQWRQTWAENGGPQEQERLDWANEGS
jgi:hypothetical protein